MTDSAIAVRIINTLESAADREAGAETALVSVSIEMLARADAGSVEVSTTRKTRTLLFIRADFRNDAGALIASANSVHKLAGAS
ncbi:MAG: hypothetical protein HY054_03225 [Proteobacteria bacterium]|nr:hypothetical protein [Pseudomonadota bacterium]